MLMGLCVIEQTNTFDTVLSRVSKVFVFLFIMWAIERYVVRCKNALRYCVTLPYAAFPTGQPIGGMRCGTVPSHRKPAFDGEEGLWSVRSR